MSKEIVKTTAKIKEIEVVDGQVLKCAGLTVLPWLFFERIEQCKLCKNVCNATLL
jgi:hypothetical protein